MLTIETALERIPLLRTLDDSFKQNLVKVFELCKYEKGVYVLQMGEIGEHVLFVAHGRLHVTRSDPKGKEVIIARLKEGSIFGEIAALTGVDRSACVVTATDCSILRISKVNFEKELLANAAFSRALLSSLALRVRDASDKISDLALKSVPERLTRTLEQIAEPADPSSGFELVVHCRPTHSETSDMIGSSREVVSRSMKQLEKEEQIKVSGSKIYLKPFSKNMV